MWKQIPVIEPNLTPNWLYVVHSKKTRQKTRRNPKKKQFLIFRFLDAISYFLFLVFFHSSLLSQAKQIELLRKRKKKERNKKFSFRCPKCKKTDLAYFQKQKTQHLTIIQTKMGSILSLHRNLKNEDSKLYLRGYTNAATTLMFTRQKERNKKMA